MSRVREIVAGVWTRWVAWVDRTEDRRPLTWVRVLAPLAVLGDLLAMIPADAIDAVLYPASRGGIGPRHDPWFLFDRWWFSGLVLWGLCALSMPLISAGIATRYALVVGVVAYAQMGHMFVPGDRAIDRLLRTVMIILFASAVSDRHPPAKIRAWASDLVRWLLVMVYLQAGIVKLSAVEHWLWRRPPELYTILADPLAGNLDPVFWSHYPVLFWIGGWGTLLVELSSPLVLTRVAPYWALCAMPIHIGIAATMDLGMFSYGMLSLYPVLFAPWIVEAHTRWERRAANR